MLNYREYVEAVILRGTFVLSEMEDKINKLWVEGKLTDADREALIPMAAEYADDRFQVNVMEQLADLGRRVWALENPVDQYRIWYKGLEVLKHEIVRYDVTGDGEYDLCQYNGGRASTVSWIGGIDGWNLLDRELNVTHTITRDADKNFIITPIEPEPEPTPEPETDSETLPADDGTNAQVPDETPSESTTEGEGA